MKLCLPIPTNLVSQNCESQSSNYAELKLLDFFIKNNYAHPLNQYAQNHRKAPKNETLREKNQQRRCFIYHVMKQSPKVRRPSCTPTKIHPMSPMHIILCTRKKNKVQSLQNSKRLFYRIYPDFNPQCATFWILPTLNWPCKKQIRMGKDD